MYEEYEERVRETYNRRRPDFCLEIARDEELHSHRWLCSVTVKNNDV